MAGHFSFRHSVKAWQKCVLHIYDTKQHIYKEDKSYLLIYRTENKQSTDSDSVAILQVKEWRTVQEKSGLYSKPQPKHSWMKTTLWFPKDKIENTPCSLLYVQMGGSNQQLPGRWIALQFSFKALQSFPNCWATEMYEVWLVAEFERPTWGQSIIHARTHA